MPLTMALAGRVGEERAVLVGMRIMGYVGVGGAGLSGVAAVVGKTVEVRTGVGARVGKIE